MSFTDGVGGSVTFSGVAANAISITAPDVSRGVIDTTTLATTTAKTSTPTDLYAAGQCSATFDFANVDNLTSLITGATATLDINYGSALGKISASAYIVRVAPPTMSEGQRMTQTITWQLTGAVTRTAPT